MKKTLSIILSVIMIITSLTAGLTAFAAEDEYETSFAVASDFHYNLPREELEGPIDDEIYWYANRRAAMEDESGFIIDEFLRQAAENDDVEFVLIPGDLADNGRTIYQEHYDVAAKLKAFEESSGKQVYVTPGNHDVGAADIDTKIDDFKKIYAEFGYDQALYIDDENGSYTANLGKKYRLISLDSCDPSKSTEDGLSIDEVMWVCNEADKALEEGRHPILMMHHNLLDHMPMQRILSRNFIVKFHYSTANLFANHGIKLVFTGHEHCSDVTSFTSTSGNVIYDFANTSLTMYPLQYRMIYLNKDEIKYEAKTIDSIDLDALTATVNGYTDEQLALMDAGLNEYAKGFLKAGVEYRLELSLSREKLGIDEDAFYADLVFTAVDGLLEILNAPLYGEGGVQELAKEYNIDIPDSEYETAWDLATELVSYHYAGEEPYTLYSKEVKMLLRTVALILLDDLSTVNDEIFLGAANDLLANLGISGISKELTKLGTEVFGPVTAGEYFLLSIAAPLLYEFGYDSDGVNDNNGVIEGYGAQVDNLGNLGDAANNLLGKISLYLSFFLDIISKIFVA